MKKTYHGSCVCGTVKFEADLDLAQGTNRCNCSFCKKARFWFTFAKTGEFRLLQGAESLSSYQRTLPGKDAPFLNFQFCRQCGIRGFTQGGELPQFGGAFHAINIACLDDATDEELSQAPIHYADGRGDDWNAEAEGCRYL